MNQQNSDPLVTTFDNLLALREYAAKYPHDAAIQFVSFCAANMTRSKSQLFQDLFVVFFLNGKQNGFFVEFGAADGQILSNTAILERDFGWKGILSEPARGWHNALKANRKSVIDTRCVWSETGRTL